MAAAFRFFPWAAVDVERFGVGLGNGSGCRARVREVVGIAQVEVAEAELRGELEQARGLV